MTSASKVILITGASSGFGALTARKLALAGHTVYASMQAATTRNAKAVKAASDFAEEHTVSLRMVELNVTDTASSNAAIAQVAQESGRLDVIVDNLALIVSIGLLCHTCVMLAAGLLLWVGSTSTNGGTPPVLAPYFAAKTAMDSLSVSYASEVSKWGMQTCIVSPGAYTSGTNHFSSAGKGEDVDIEKEYFEGPYKGVPERVMQGLKRLEPSGVDVGEVAESIVKVVDMEVEKRPCRVAVDPSNDDGALVDQVKISLGGICTTDYS